MDKKYAFEAKKIKGLRALHDHVLVSDMQFGQRQLSSGLVLLNDDGKGDGIRPRWAKVYAIGPEQREVVPGQWILVAHGRWTRANEVEIDGVQMKLRRIDPSDMLMVSDTEPGYDDTLSTAVNIDAKAL
jgi:hypothetical protein